MWDKVNDFLLSLIVFLLALLGVILSIFIIPVRVAWDMAGWYLKWTLGEDWDARPKWNWREHGDKSTSDV